MSYIIAKNIFIKKDRISADIADSSITDWNNKFIFNHCNDLYSSLKSIEDKEANLVYDIIIGNLHVNNTNKYSNLLNAFEYFEDFVNEFTEALRKKDYDTLHFIYRKYKGDINSWLVKDCYIKNELENHYLYSITKDGYRYTYNPSKKFNSNFIKNKTYFLDKGFVVIKDE